jgi:hypothetical protein
MIDAIAKLWKQGKPLSAIGEALGISRGQAAGAIDRARKAGDLRFPLRPSKPPPKPEAKHAPPTTVVAPPPAGRKLLIDLPTDGCRYPTGLADDGRHLFCGRPRAPGRPYCRRCDEALSVSSASASSPRAPSARARVP